MNSSAQTNPPQNAGDWTIPTNDITYYNNSQTLIQGDIHIYGTLIVQNSNVFLWGANNGDRNVYIYSGGEFTSMTLFYLVILPHVLISYTGSKYILTAQDLTQFVIEVNSKDVYFNNTKFEKSRLNIDIDESDSIFHSSNGTTTYQVNHTYSNLIFANSSNTQDTLLWIENPNVPR